MTEPNPKCCSKEALGSSQYLPIPTIQVPKSPKIKYLKSNVRKSSRENLKLSNLQLLAKISFIVPSIMIMYSFRVKFYFTLWNQNYTKVRINDGMKAFMICQNEN